MREPPPSPLEISASNPENDHRSKSPCRPSLGSQKFDWKPIGLRGNDPGGYLLPRSRTSTRLSAAAIRCAVTDPPDPLPTTMQSKGSGAATDQAAGAERRRQVSRPIRTLLATACQGGGRFGKKLASACAQRFMLARCV